MDGPRFEEWFKVQLYPNIPPHSVIVMDNAPYHSVEVNKAPISSSRKSDMQDWLREKGIEFDLTSVKTVLYSLIKLKKDTFRTYRIDTLAASHGHTVLRLPPYHCNFNPIELIWGQVKGYVAKRNVTFKSGDIKFLFLEAVNCVMPENWTKACQHAKKEEDFYREKIGILDEVMDRFVINLDDTDDDGDSDEEDNEEMEDDDDLQGICILPPDSLTGHSSSTAK